MSFDLYFDDWASPDGWGGNEPSMSLSWDDYDSWWNDASFDSIDFGNIWNYGSGYEPGWSDGQPYFPSIQMSEFRAPSVMQHAPLHDLERASFTNVSSNANPAAMTASMPLDSGLGLRMPQHPNLDYMGGGTGLTPQGFAPTNSDTTSWSDRIGKMADNVIKQLPAMAMSALIGKPKLPGGSAMNALSASMARSNQFNDQLAADYNANMPGVQAFGVNAMHQISPQAQANEAYRGAMVSEAAGRRALERSLSASGVSPEGRAAAVARYNANPNRVLAYNTALGRGPMQAINAATQVAGLFPQPSNSASGLLAATAAGLAANRGLQEFNMRQQQLADVSGLFNGYEEGRKKGMQPRSYS